MLRGSAQHPWSSIDVDLVDAGLLVLPTGSIVACDPLVSLAEARPFARSVAPGPHRVVIAMRDGDVLYASVELGGGTPRRWVAAVCAGESEPEGLEGVPGYGVDAGTGCFVDAATAAAWNVATNAWLAEKVQRVNEAGVDANDAGAWHAAMRALDGERPELDLLARLQAAGYRRRPYAAIEIDGGTLVAFTSGAGDGVYPSYWGLDERGDAVVLLTDFGLLDREDEEEADEEADEEVDEEVDEQVDEEVEDQPGAPPAEPAFLRLATALLDRLLRDELVVLVRPGKRKALDDEFADMLATIADDGSRGAALAEWLSERDDIEEVFASDDELEHALAETIRVVR